MIFEINLNNIIILIIILLILYFLYMNFTKSTNSSYLNEHMKTIYLLPSREILIEQHRTTRNIKNNEVAILNSVISKLYKLNNSIENMNKIQEKTNQIEKLNNEILNLSTEITNLMNNSPIHIIYNFEIFEKSIPTYLYTNVYKYDEENIDTDKYTDRYIENTHTIGKKMIPNMAIESYYTIYIDGKNLFKFRNIKQMDFFNSNKKTIMKKYITFSTEETNKNNYHKYYVQYIELNIDDLNPNKYTSAEGDDFVISLSV